MPGSVVDLSVARSRIPDLIVVDTNLIVERLVVPFLGVLPSSPAAKLNAHRANQFFQTLIANDGRGIVTPTAFNEFVHVAIKSKYKQERLRLGPNVLPTSGRRINSWLDLYKQDASILQAFLINLERFRLQFIVNGLLFIAPDELGPITSGRAYDEELVHLVGTYGLDSNDALILMEARRSGINDVVTLDADLRRAQADFNIYTWL